MLVLRRKEGQWVEIRHRSGDLLRIRVANIRARFPGQLDLAFDDESFNFEVQRPERVERDRANDDRPGPDPGGRESDPAASEPVPVRPLARRLSEFALRSRRRRQSS